MIGGMNVQMLARSQLGWDLTGSSLAVTLVGVGFAPPMPDRVTDKWRQHILPRPIPGPPSYADKERASNLQPLATVLYDGRCSS